MTYPYDGIRSSIEYYNNYIEYLEAKIKELEQENQELKEKIANLPKVKKYGKL